MSQQFVPPTRAPLIDGRDLRVEADGVHVGEQFYPLTQIQEARMLFLRPETIALTLASVGQVEYSFARPGDGVAALEALSRLRPEMRRPDAPAPALDAPAGYLASVAPPPAQPQPSMPYAPTALPGGQPGAPFGAPHTGYPPAPYPSYAPYAPYPPRQMAPVPFPPPVVEAYGPSPNRTHAGLTPAPRAAGQLIGSTFHLFGKRLGPLLALALVVAALPSAAIALLDALVSALSGVNPLAGAPNPLDTLQQMVNGQTPATTAPATTAATPLDTTIGLLSLIAVVLTLLVAAWTQAALTVGAREVTLGKRLSIRACAREGLTRLWPTLWALFFLYGVLAIIAIPGLGLALAIMAGVITAITLMIVAYLWSRFALYPTAAALGLPQPLRVAFTLTAFGWWRVFSALLVVTLVTLALTLSASGAQLLSVAVAAVLLAPLAQLIAGPLGALIRVGVLYDQRLRREGYALFQQEGIAPPADASAQPTPEHPTEVSR